MRHKMDKDLRRSAIINASILTLIFGLQTVQAIASNSLLGFLSLIATLSTATDVYRFYKA